MAHDFDFRLPVLDDLPIGSALAEDRLWHYVEQWLAFDSGAAASSRAAVVPNRLAAIRLGLEAQTSGSGSVSIVPHAGDIIPNPEQSELGQ